MLGARHDSSARRFSPRWRFPPAAFAAQAARWPCVFVVGIALATLAVLAVSHSPPGPRTSKRTSSSTGPRTSRPRRSGPT